MADPKATFLDKLKWLSRALESKQSSTVAKKIVEVREAYNALNGTPAHTECAAQMAEAEVGVAKLQMEDKAEELSSKGCGAANSYKRQTDLSKQQQFYAQTKQIYTEFEQTPQMKATTHYEKFLKLWKEIQTNDPKIDTSLASGAATATATATATAAPTATAATPAKPAAAAATAVPKPAGAGPSAAVAKPAAAAPSATVAASPDLAKAKAHFDDRKKWTVMALDSGRSSVADVEKKVQEVRDAFAATKNTAAEAECASAMAKVEEQLAMFKLKALAEELSTKGRSVIGTFNRLRSDQELHCLEDGEDDIKKKNESYTTASEIAAKLNSDPVLKNHPDSVKFFAAWKEIENTDLKAWEAELRKQMVGLRTAEQLDSSIAAIQASGPGGMIRNSWKNTKVDVKLSFPEEGISTTTTVNASNTCYGLWTKPCTVTILNPPARTFRVQANEGIEIAPNGSAKVIS